MVKTTFIFAALLVLVGVIGYLGGSSSSDALEAASDPVEVASDDKPAKRSVTALIPVVAGVLLGICGAIGLREKLRIHAMHAAVLVGLLGCIAAAGRGTIGLVKLISTEADVNVRSLVFVWLMAAICGSFVAVCVNSFMQARKRQGK